MMELLIPHDRVLKFWFQESGPQDWFKQDSDFDAKIKLHFETTLAQASRGELWPWRESLKGRLAEIIVLDQFTRNIHRGTATAFAQDTLALILAQEALRDGRHLRLDPSLKAFLYMPFMHSESLVMHEMAVELFSQNGLESNLDFELRHKRIIERFGRYPHRNSLLGRPSTAAEIEFLNEPGSSF